MIVGGEKYQWRGRGESLRLPAYLLAAAAASGAVAAFSGICRMGSIVLFGSFVRSFVGRILISIIIISTGGELGPLRVPGWSLSCLHGLRGD